ncbi:MAG: response regulator [Elusimicrobiales bacterium]|nr:response regulator [Elusimicrobiales bacterium]
MKKILAIDDDPSILLLYAEILKKEGYDVFCAEDGICALQRYRDAKPDLVLLDFEMPAGGGMGVFEALRGSMAQPVPVIFVTAHPQEDVGVTLKLYKVGYLRKPFTRAVLVEKVRQMLGETVPPAPPAAPPTTTVPPPPPAVPNAPAPPKPPPPPAGPPQMKIWEDDKK